MNQVTKSSVIAAIYVMFEGVTKHWYWDDDALNLILSTSRLPIEPTHADVERFLEQSDLLFWRLAVDNVGIWAGKEPAEAFIGTHPFWSVEVWYDEEHRMPSAQVSSTIMLMASSNAHTGRS
jgi:hypothetical protein